MSMNWVYSVFRPNCIHMTAKKNMNRKKDTDCGSIRGMRVKDRNFWSLVKNVRLQDALH